MRRLSLTAWVTGAVILAATVFVFVELQPSLLFRNTTPSGGDMGAHVWGPAYLRDHLLPHGRLTGWTPDWYAGFPALHFYFPLPSLLIVALDVVLPYGIAFKLVTVLGLLTLPVAAYVMGRLAGMKDPVPACLAIVMVPFLFDRTFTIYGGNIPSTLAGEFAFSISLSVALVFLGVFAKALQTGRYRALSAGLLAITALCHVVPAFFAIGGAVVLTILRWHRRAWVHAFWTFAVSGLLAAFWVVPFMARLAYTNDMGWEKIETYRETLMYSDRLLVLAIFGAVVSLLLTILGVFWSRDLRRRNGAFLSLLAIGSAAAFVLAPQGRLWNARLLPFWVLTTYMLVGAGIGEVGRVLARGLAHLYSPQPAFVPDETGAVDASEFAALSDRDDRGMWPPPPPPPEDHGRVFEIANLVVPVATLALALYLVALPLPTMPSWAPGKPPAVEQSFIPAWVRWNYTGYEGKASYPEYRHLIDTMAVVGEGHGCGRAMWEYEPELDRLGTPMALMLLPHWTDGCIGSMEGLFFESSATTPYHFLNQAELSYKPSSAQRDLQYRSLYGDAQHRADVVGNGINHLQLLGVRYFMALSDEVKEASRINPELELVATSGPWNVTYNRTNELVGVQQRTWEVYKVADSDLVMPLDYKPAVMQGVEKGGDPWLHAAEDWYMDEGRWDVFLSASGPKDWPRVRGADPDPPQVPVDAPEVTNVRSTDDRISFNVSKPGTPVLVKTSYFPNWQASGADGPWRVTPNLMVVVPTSTHVELHYGQTPVDVAAWLMTLLGAVGLVFLSRRRPLDLAPAAE
jgi:hypothetical protein